MSIKTQELKKILKNRVFWELKKAYQKYLSKSPKNCKFCGDFMLNGTPLDVCLIKGQKGLNPLFLTEDGIYICDAEEARICTKFSCKHSKDSLRSSFELEVLKNPEKMRESYKDLYVLTHLVDLSSKDDKLVPLGHQVKSVWEKLKDLFRKLKWKS